MRLIHDCLFIGTGLEIRPLEGVRHTIYDISYNNVNLLLRSSLGCCVCCVWV